MRKGGDVSRQKKEEEGKKKKKTVSFRFSDPVMYCLERTNGFCRECFTS